MIKLDLSADPTAQKTIEIRLGDKVEKMKVTYRIFDREEASELMRKQLDDAERIFAAGDSDQEARLAALHESLSPKKQEEIEDELVERIVEWDLLDTDRVPLPVTPENISAVLRHGPFFRPLWQGLIDASTGAKSKN